MTTSSKLKSLVGKEVYNYWNNNLVRITSFKNGQFNVKFPKGFILKFDETKLKGAITNTGKYDLESIIAKAKKY